MPERERTGDDKFNANGEEKELRMAEEERSEVKSTANLIPIVLRQIQTGSEDVEFEEWMKRQLDYVHNNRAVVVRLVSN
jgi:hypothetical protein